MYVLIVYDVGVDRVAKIHKLLKQFLHWRQNSVFEGEISEAQIEKVKAGLKILIDADYDSVLVYTARDERWINRESIGTDKNTTDNMI